MTIGDPDDSADDCDEVIDLHERFKKMAFDEDSFAPTIFVDDKDILPSTSNTNIDSLAQSAQIEDTCATAALASVFGKDNRLFQPITAGTFIEEVVVEKPPKVVNVSNFQNNQ